MNVYRDKHDTGYLELEEDYSNLFEKHDEIKVLIQLIMKFWKSSKT